MRNYDNYLHASAGFTDQLIAFAESQLARPEYVRDKRKVEENLCDLIDEIRLRLEERGYDVIVQRDRYDD